jgi:hypothetical protein
MKHLKIEWIDAGREPQCPADPRWPNGVELIQNEDAAAHCITLLPYPAPRCGVWSITCEKCGKIVVVTAAGRADDPHSIAIACQGKANA